MRCGRSDGVSMNTMPLDDLLDFRDVEQWDPAAFRSDNGEDGALRTSRVMTNEPLSRGHIEEKSGI